MIRYWHALPLILALTGCLGSSPPVPRDYYYRAMVPAPEDVTQGPKFEGVLVVNPFQANALLRERALTYSLVDRQHVVQQHSYHYWADPPPQMLQQQMVDFLRRVDFATSVTLPDRRQSPDFDIDGRIRRLERVIGDDRQRVAVELELTMTRLRDRETIVAEIYAEELEASDGRVESSIRAINQAFGRIFRRFVSDAGRTLTARADRSAD